jgi:hypothetical protein
MGYYKINGGEDVTDINLKKEGISIDMLNKAHKIANQCGFMNVCEYAAYYGLENGIEAVKDIMKLKKKGV